MGWALPLIPGAASQDPTVGTVARKFITLLPYQNATYLMRHKTWVTTELVNDTTDVRHLSMLFLLVLFGGGRNGITLKSRSLLKAANRRLISSPRKTTTWTRGRSFSWDRNSNIFQSILPPQSSDKISPYAWKLRVGVLHVCQCYSTEWFEYLILSVPPLDLISYLVHGC